MIITVKILFMGKRVLPFSVFSIVDGNFTDSLE